MRTQSSKRQTLIKARKSWLLKRHRVIVTIDTSIGEITIPLGFGKESDAKEAFDLLINGARNVVGASLIIKNKFVGGRDGLAS